LLSLGVINLVGGTILILPRAASAISDEKLVQTLIEKNIEADMLRSKKYPLLSPLKSIKETIRNKAQLARQARVKVVNQLAGPDKLQEQVINKAFQAFIDNKTSFWFSWF
jgi:hypothetical protein